LKTIPAVQLSSSALIEPHLLSKVPSKIAIARDSEQFPGINCADHGQVDDPFGSGASAK